MAHIEDKTFRNEVLTVDGTQYTRCVFQGATLVYAGGDLPTFVDCRFDNVALQFDGAAARTVSFLAGLRDGGFSVAVSKIVAVIRGRKP